MWEENKCHPESLCSGKQCFRDCPFLTFYWGVVFICKGNCLFWIFLNFTLVNFTYSTICFMSTAQWVLKNAELYGNPPQEARYRIYLSPTKVLSYSLWLLPSPVDSPGDLCLLCHAHLCCPAWHRGTSMLFVWTVWPLLWLSIYDDFMHLIPCPGIVFPCLWEGSVSSTGLAFKLYQAPICRFFYLRFMKTWKTPACKTPTLRTIES